MKSLKKPIWMLAFQGMGHLSVNLLRDHYQHSSLSAKYFPAIFKKNFVHTSKLFLLREILPGWLFSFRTAMHAASGQVLEQQPAVDQSDLPGHKIHPKTRKRLETQWVPLIKAKQVIPSDYGQDSARIRYDRHSLAGQMVLCVGGRAALYSDYLRLVEAAGGRLLTYRGNHGNNRDQLATMLARASMVICPVDCVSHDDYFAVKRYCQLSGKLCAFLERSNLPTFSRGLAMLVLQSEGDHLRE